MWLLRNCFYYWTFTNNFNHLFFFPKNICGSREHQAKYVQLHGAISFPVCLNRWHGRGHVVLSFFFCFHQTLTIVSSAPCFTIIRKKANSFNVKQCKLQTTKGQFLCFRMGWLFLGLCCWVLLVCFGLFCIFGGRVYFLFVCLFGFGVFWVFFFVGFLFLFCLGVLFAFN